VGAYGFHEATVEQLRIFVMAWSRGMSWLDLDEITTATQDGQYLRDSNQLVRRLNNLVGLGFLKTRCNPTRRRGHPGKLYSITAAGRREFDRIGLREWGEEGWRVGRPVFFGQAV